MNTWIFILVTKFVERQHKVEKLSVRYIVDNLDFIQLINYFKGYKKPC
jgi:hypothetical protein